MQVEDPGLASALGFGFVALLLGEHANLMSASEALDSLGLDDGGVLACSTLQGWLSVYEQITPARLILSVKLGVWTDAGLIIVL